jgi:site-specific DNA-methyltransferase (adenine-specific)/adenine-specific DNA-methyltransferase
VRARPALQGDKAKDGIVEKIHLKKHRTDGMDYWAVDFDYLQRKEIIRVPVGLGCRVSSRRKANCRHLKSAGSAATSSRGMAKLPHGLNRNIELTSAAHLRSTYRVADKVINIFGDDTATLVSIHLG